MRTIQTQKRAVIAVSCLYLIFILLSFSSVLVVEGQSLSVADALRAWFGILVAPVVLSLPLIDAVSVFFNGDPPALIIASLLLISVGSVLGYWALLGWLSWRATSRLSYSAAVILAAILLPSAFLLPLAYAWIAAF